VRKAGLHTFVSVGLFINGHIIFMEYEWILMGIEWNIHSIMEYELENNGR
jgi:hypothetical protein